MSSTEKKKRLEEAFLALYERDADTLFRHCYLRLSSRERAREIAQEAFCKVWTMIVEEKPIMHLRGLVYRVAKNLVIDEFRKKKEVSLEAMQDEGFDVSDEHAVEKMEHAVEVKEVFTVLEKLEEEYRIVLIMRHVDGFRPKEIAEILEISPDLVSVRLHRGMKMLRELLHHA